MNKNMLIVLAGGLLIAVIVAVLVSMSLGRNKQVAVAPVAPPTQIVVAAKNLAGGITLQDSDLKWQDWPANSVFPGAVSKKGSQSPLEAVNGVLLHPVSAGEPVLESSVMKGGKGNIVAASLGDGMRAVAIGVSAQSTAGGFVVPGDHVDILLTYRKVVNMASPAMANDPQVKEMLSENLESFATETIMQDVKVLAVDQTAEQPADEKGGKVGRTITIEVSSRAAETMALATQLGQLTLALRNPGDHTVVDNSKQDIVTDERVTHIRRQLYVAAHKLSGQDNGSVRIYNGYNVQDQTTAGP